MVGSDLVVGGDSSGCWVFDRWMTVADGMGVQGVFLQWLVVAGYG